MNSESLQFFQQWMEQFYNEQETAYIRVLHFKHLPGASKSQIRARILKDQEITNARIGQAKRPYCDFQ